MLLQVFHVLQAAAHYCVSMPIRCMQCMTSAS